MSGTRTVGCPVVHGPASALLTPTGCPVSGRAADFDPFGDGYQQDPPEYLRWAREQEPVFWSPRLGYWVVTRYASVKAIFRDTNASSEAVINGSALEKIDDTADNASVLVSVRVTVTNLDGVNAPSKPYRLRVIVHEDDNGRMTGYDLKYPDGGN